MFLKRLWFCLVWKSTVWTKTASNLIAQFPICLLSQKSLRNVWPINSKSMLLLTIWMKSFNRRIRTIIALRPLLFVCIMTFCAHLIKGNLWYYYFYTSRLLLILWTTPHCWHEYQLALTLAEKHWHGSNLTYLPDHSLFVLTFQPPRAMIFWVVSYKAPFWAHFYTPSTLPHLQTLLGDTILSFTSVPMTHNFTWFSTHHVPGTLPDTAKCKIEACVLEMYSWLLSNGLMLSKDKTKLTIISSMFRPPRSRAQLNFCFWWAHTRFLSYQ